MPKFDHNLLPLRPYQQYPLDKRFDHLDDNVIIQMPTGTGKGNIILHEIIRNIDEDRKVLVIVPNVYLVDNIADRLKDQARNYYNYGFHGVHTGSEKIYEMPITIGVYKSMYNALKNGDIDDRTYDVIIVDECHRVRSNTYDELLQLKAVKTGYTATPNRLDGKPLNKVFNQIYKSPNVDWFIENKYLSPYKLFSISDGEIADNIKTHADQLELQQQILNNEIKIGELVNHWRKYALGMKTIIFASGIEHGKAITKKLNKEFEGKYIFQFIDSSTPISQRRSILSDFRENRITGLVNVEILTEGVDIDNAECVIMDRFTNSVVLWLQCIGRCLRYKPNKLAVILDLVGNARIHGSPSFDHDWSLDGQPLMNDNFTLSCSGCGIPLITKARAVKFPEGITIECPNCLKENYFKVEIIGTKRRTKNDPFVLDDHDLVEFTANDSAIKIYKILSSKKSYQFKLEKLLNLNVDRDLKYKAFKLLGMSPSKISFYLD